MDEYIKREDAIKHLRGACMAKYPLSFSNGISAAAKELLQMPTADVVPKSEVERLQEDVERLQEINDRYVENIRLAKTEVAREIFEEIDEILFDYESAMKAEYRNAFEARFAELKEKYTEQCPQCKHFVGCDPYKTMFYKTSGERCDEYKGGDQ